MFKRPCQGASDVLLRSLPKRGGPASIPVRLKVTDSPSEIADETAFFSRCHRFYSLLNLYPIYQISCFIDCTFLPVRSADLYHSFIHS